MKKLFGKIASVFFLVGCVAVIIAYYYFHRSPDMKWTMVNVNYSAQQGDAHVITIKNGKTILIDVGHRDTVEQSLLPFLEENSIKEIDIVFISHPHKDHYGGLDLLLDRGVIIKEIYFNIPDKEICDNEIPWGCDYADILRLHEKLKTKDVAVKIAEAGQKITLGDNTWVEIVYAFDGINTPVGRTGVNDLSLIMMLHHEKFKFLFTGDLNIIIGTYLAKVADGLSADILKVPHHGTESIAPNEFFEKVSPEYALVPSPKDLWLSKRSEKIRNWFQQNNIPTYVNGISGNIQVTVDNNELTVSVEKEGM